MMRHQMLIPLLLMVGAAVFSCGGGGGSSGSASQTAWYVDSVSGNDNNAGTSAAPWRTLAKVSAFAFPAGSTIYLKRGSVWFEQLTVLSSGITIDAYGAGPLPVIDGSAPVTGWSETAVGSGIYSSATITLTASADEALGNLSENGALMSFQTWTVDAATTFFLAPMGAYSYDYAQSRLYTKPSSTPSGNTYRASVRLYGVKAEAKHDVIVRNLDISRFSLHGIEFKDCLRCEARSSIVSRGGGAVVSMGPPYLYAGNGIEFDNMSTNGVVDSVTVSDIFDSGISPQTWKSGQTMQSILISNASISACGFAGIEVSVLSNGSTTNSSISGVLISNVTITASGRGWSGRRYGTEGHGIRIIADKGAGTMSNIRLERTIVQGSLGDGVKLGGEIGTVNMHRMNIHNNANGINLSEVNATTTKMRLTSSLVYHNTNWGVVYNSSTAAGFELLQNTLSDNGTINLAVSSASSTAAAAMRIQNNIFYGSSSMTHLYSFPTLTSATINNNCYNEIGNIFGYAGIPYTSVAAFQSATTFEANGIGGNVGLTNPAAGSFTLTSASICTARGSSTVGVADDYDGYLFASPPSSGAYQFR